MVTCHDRRPKPGAGTRVFGIIIPAAAALSTAACAVPAPSPRSADAIYGVVFRHLVTDALASDDARAYVFRYRLLLPPGQEALRLVPELDADHAAEEQLAEWHLNDDGPVRKVALSPALRRPLDRVASSHRARRRTGALVRRSGVLTLQAGQIRWDGTDEAMVEAGRAYTFFEKRDGVLLAWSYRLRKVGGAWRVQRRKRNLAAG